MRRRRLDRQVASDEVSRLRRLLADAQATLHAIRSGEVDAVVVASKSGPQVYTLESAEFDYRILIESMHEGALILSPSTVIMYANTHFARMVERPLAKLLGSSLNDLLSPADRLTMSRLMKRPDSSEAAMEALLQRATGAPMPVKLSLQRFLGRGAGSGTVGIVVSDLTEPRTREAMLRGFSQSLMHVQERERLQMSTDLGDNIAQMLCTILMRCQMLAQRLPDCEDGLRSEALEFAKLLRTTASEVQRISTELRPHGLEILGLASALRGMVAEFAERMGVPIQVNCARIATHLPAEVELALYRVLQQALRNVEQHAQARHVTVTLRRRGAAIHLVIKDDGIGFDTSGQMANAMRDGRFGLLSMRERVTALGGSLVVNSTTSAGTEVRLTVPLSPECAASQQ